MAEAVAAVQGEQAGAAGQRAKAGNLQAGRQAGCSTGGSGECGCSSRPAGLQTGRQDVALEAAVTDTSNVAVAACSSH